MSLPNSKQPPACWIFQFNPDKWDENILHKGTTLTWYVGQHESLIEAGPTVYVWRAAGKGKRRSGIVAVGVLQGRPKVQRHFHQHLGQKREYETDEPELCVSMLIESVFLEDEKLLSKETLKTDSVLKDLLVVTTPRGTNYPIDDKHQAQRLSQLIEQPSKPAQRAYKDFGEAPNDDPNELREFASKVRRGQPKFRSKLIQLYGAKCAITGTAVSEVLEACHIARHSNSGINHSENGILLRSDIHTLFDEGLIGIDPSTMTISVTSKLRATDYGQYHGKHLLVRSDGSQISLKYLTERKKYGNLMND